MVCLGHHAIFLYDLQCPEHPILCTSIRIPPGPPFTGALGYADVLFEVEVPNHIPILQVGDLIQVTLVLPLHTAKMQMKILDLSQQLPQRIAAISFDISELAQSLVGKVF